ncbi:DeoR family transcriptional regulator [Deinococcus sp. UYEF24]
MVGVKNLADEFVWPAMSVRHDLNARCEAGRLSRVHGGAWLLDQTCQELPHTLPAGQNIEALECIAHTGSSAGGQGENGGVSETESIRQSGANGPCPRFFAGAECAALTFEEPELKA